MHVNGTALLCKARHFHHAGPLAINLGRLGQQGTNRNNTRTPNTSGNDVKRFTRRNRWHHWIGQIRQFKILAHLLFRCCPWEGHKRWTESVYTTEILIAGGLINHAFAAQFGFHRRDCDAVGLHTTIATALANIGIDENTFVWIGKEATFATSTFFCSACLHINNGAYAVDLTQFFLNSHQICAFVFFNVTWEGRKIQIFFIVIDNNQLFDTHRL